MAGSLLRYPGSRAASQQYVSELHAIYGFETDIFDPDYALAQDPAIYDKLERDPVIYHALQTRFHSIISGPWHMEPSSDSEIDKAGATLMEDIFGRIKRFAQSRYLLSRGGLLTGRGYAYAQGSRRKRKIDGGPMLDWWQPVRLKDIDKRRIRFMPTHPNEPGVTPGQKMRYAPIGKTTFEDVALEAQQALIPLTYQDREERLGHGQGMATPLYHYFYAKGQVWRDYLQGMSRWAQGIIAAQIGDERLASADKTNAEMVDEWLDTLDTMRSRHALVFGKSDEFKVFDMGGPGADMCLSAIEYIDRAIVRLVLGSIRPSGADTDTGALAQAQVEQEQTDVLIQHDRALHDEAITEHLLSLTWRTNRGNLVAQGIGDAEMPRFVTTADRKKDPKAAAELIEIALRSDIPLPRDWVYEQIDAPQPGENDKVFRSPVAETGFPFDLPDFEQQALDPDRDGIAGPSIVGGEEVAPEGIEPPNMQELSLSYERAIKNGDRATANVVRKKLWAVLGEETAPDISDVEWATMTATSGGGVEPVPPTAPRTTG